MEWPADGRLTGEFGQAANRLGGTAVRNGVEIAAAEGTTVRAVHGGTVAHADTYPGFGNLVILDHGTNHYTLYGYLGAISVTAGQTVASGTEVGIVGPSPAGPRRALFRAARRRPVRGSRTMAQAAVMSGSARVPSLTTKFMSLGVAT